MPKSKARVKRQWRPKEFPSEGVARHDEIHKRSLVAVDLGVIAGLCDVMDNYPSNALRKPPSQRGGIMMQKSLLLPGTLIFVDEVTIAKDAVRDALINDPRTETVFVDAGNKDYKVCLDALMFDYTDQATIELSEKLLLINEEHQCDVLESHLYLLRKEARGEDGQDMMQIGAAKKQLESIEDVIDAIKRWGGSPGDGIDHQAELTHVRKEQKRMSAATSQLVTPEVAIY